MKHLQTILMLVPVLLLGACQALPGDAGYASAVGVSRAQEKPDARGARPSASSNRVVIHDAAGSAEVEKIEFRAGVSSVNVERIAKRFSCTGGAGAGLITEKGPVEVYRMQCDNGTTFLARCELRQCRPMR